MADLSPFPDWVEETLVTDTAFTAAYDAVDATRRAELKLALARLAACYGEVPVGSETVSRSMRQGFLLKEARRAVDFALVFWDAPYVGPTRILAALMPAVLAGTPRILACRVCDGTDAPPFPPPVLAALELAGQELVADIGPDRAGDLLHHCGNLRRAGQAGRMVILGDAAFAASMQGLALEAGVAAHCFAGPVVIGVAEDGLPAALAVAHRESGGGPGGMLDFAHPDARFVSADTSAFPPLNAVFCAEEAADRWLSRCPLVLTPGHETCWLWPGLTPEFFMDHSMGICP